MRLPRLPLGSPLLLAAATLLSVSPLAAQNIRTGTIAQRYQDFCANCHGKQLEGGKSPGGKIAPTLLDHQWLHGGEDDDIAKSIRVGYPANEMPAWGAAIPEKEIRAMVIYLREQQFVARRGQMPPQKQIDSLAGKSQLHDFQLNTWVTDVREPWSLAFLSPTRAIMTEKNGYVYLIDNGKVAPRPLIGVPRVDTGGQAGLYDVVPHPDFARNGWIYFSYSDPQKNAAGQNVSLTRIARAQLQPNGNNAPQALVDWQTIYQAPVEVYPIAGGVHFGGRIAFGKDGYLYFTIGERGTGTNAQNLEVPMGKVHRIHDDGRVPEDNPFSRDPKTMKTIWSYGHRNPQGLAVNPATGAVYDAEHGPRGGDEINFVQRGKNYGWPVITYGMEYNGTAMTDITAKEGMEQPVTYYVPSIAVCGISFYTGDAFPKWKNSLFLASLAGKELRRLEINGDKLVTQEVLLKGDPDDDRIRHVIGGPDGALYVLFRNRIARIAPAK